MHDINKIVIFSQQNVDYTKRPAVFSINRVHRLKSIYIFLLAFAFDSKTVQPKMMIYNK